MPCLDLKELFMIMVNKEEILGVILAGGKSRRMGNKNKSLLTINNRPLVEITTDLVKNQLSKIIINSNSPLKTTSKLNFNIIPDNIPGYLGPLCGIFSAMKWTKKNFSDCKWIASFPVDSIFFPHNFVEVMVDKIKKETQIVCAKSNGRTHPVFALWSVNLVNDLEKALINDGIRKMDEWTKRYNLEIVNFKNTKIDPFFNINNPDDLIKARKIYNEMFV